MLTVRLLQRAGTGAAWRRAGTAGASCRLFSNVSTVSASPQTTPIPATVSLPHPSGFSPPIGVGCPLSGVPAPSAAATQGFSQHGRTQNAREVRAFLTDALAPVSVHDLVNGLLSEAAGPSGEGGRMVTKEGFRHALSRLATGPVMTPSLRETMVDRTFDLLNFNTPTATSEVPQAVAGGVVAVPVPQLAIPLVHFCRGGARERIGALFALFDQDGSGTIERSELREVFRMIFRFAVTPRSSTVLRDFGVVFEDADHLASITADVAFSVADSDGDGHITPEEFRRWAFLPVSELMGMAGESGDPTGGLQTPLAGLVKTVLQPPCIGSGSS
uniref:EF-hand domain-containing protein n=1 Tax=Chromera velia CCMP2878 TaxID=1169474 RepID=A0A0G4FZP9_9ALVE|mmetsp:Transcript_2266/g.4766  ORF Transcript_2266/g.4766 Transcript_2266/m.4766 type:complete len:330 (+) Transcript_2266:179-1168(+)|eukprot:Cvel_19534.t1-p1 / transcript=Cvel_19534.t1 / gene=Cvel_19534 / organism=Chromera_velia_CCMP2878 / gene_product=hypothetical protein / transcript_product=hypothetical protein / location=Cvel_scaffold1691:32071-33765(-) / protein_length=329 / sequence_SO=supercontig / SO=protein_coding / is_pseudo=false